ncbi:MAG: hypothetical protein P4L51_17040 [Puia sp.]|nr:hypothetical protein [Puia sp.]
MDNFENNEIKIANYLENKMSAAEELAFMQELDGDDELRKQYEEELLVRVLLGDTEASQEPHFAEEKAAPVIPMYRSYKMVAAAVLVILAGSIVFWAVERKGRPGAGGDDGNSSGIVKGTTRSVRPDSPVVVNSPVLPDSSGQIVKDNPKSNPKGATPNPKEDFLATGHATAADTLYKEFYRVYSTRIPPAELAILYGEYQARNYQAVIEASVSDYLTGVSERRNHSLEQYIGLYKGLSYLAKDDPDDALQQFDKILQSSPKTGPVYYDGQWYSALARIREDELAKAADLIKDIPQSASPYAAKAAALQKKLKELLAR